VSITFGNTGNWMQGAFYANTGMDFFNRGAPVVAFYDVEEPDGLLAAIERARGG
jgi:hypothetical protein